MRLTQKLITEIETFTFYDYFPEPDADALVIAYGVTARACRVAIRMAAKINRPASLLVLKTLWPVPEALIQKMAAPYKRVVVPEMNLGQYVREIRRLLPGKQVTFLGQMNGELITPRQIQEVIRHG